MLLKRNNYGWIALAFGLVLFPLIFVERLWRFKVIILVGTGRVGSKSFATAFGSQKSILAAHEPHWDFNSLSIGLANKSRGIKNSVRGLKYIIRLFRIRQMLLLRIGNFSSYIESNNRLSYILYSWSAAFPNTEVYMLYRNRGEVTSSAFKRKHYSEDDPYPRLISGKPGVWMNYSRKEKIEYWYTETNRIISEYHTYSIVWFPHVLSSDTYFINSFQRSFDPELLKEIYSSFPWENKN